MSPHSTPIRFAEGKVSYVSQDARCVPPVLGKLYGEKATSLDLSYNQISTLHGLELFSSLHDLIVDNNQLDDATSFPNLPSLRTLSLNNNRITNVEVLVDQVKTQIPNLEYLSLLGNIACPNQLSDVDKDEEDYQRYRYYVLHYLTKLKFLDSRPVTDEERLEARRIGHLMKVARPKFSSYMCSPDEDFMAYSPLPPIKPFRPPQGVYGKCVYRYTGKHSEGNRFIRNHQL